MAGADPVPDAAEPGWRERAVSRSVHAARSRAEQRVQRFLDAAFDLIDEKGSTEFTIQEVVDRSKQSLRAFYEYFDGKDELVLALFEETVREAVEDIEAAVDAEDRPARAACARSRSRCTNGATPTSHPASAAATAGGRSPSSRCTSPPTTPTASAPRSRRRPTCCASCCTAARRRRRDPGRRRRGAPRRSSSRR